LATQKSYYAWLAIIGAVLINFIFSGMVANTASIYIDPITKDLGILRGAFSITVTVNAIFNAICSMSYGKLLQKFGLKKVLMVGAVSMVIANLIYSVSTNIVMFYIGSAFIGIGVSLGTAITTAMIVSNWFAKHQGAIISVCAAVGGFGSIIFSPILTNWIGVYGWQTAYRFSAIACAIVAVIVAIVVRSNPAEVGARPVWSDDNAKVGGADAAVEVPGLTLKEAMKTSNLWFITLLVFFLGASVFPVLSVLAPHIMDNGFSLSVVGLSFSILFIVNTIFQVPYGAACDKFGSKSVLVVNILFFIACLWLLALPHLSLTLVYVGAGLTGLSLVLIQVPLPLIIADVFGRKDYGGIMGFVMSAMVIGIALGTPITNFAFDILKSYRSMFIVFIPVAVLCIIFVLIGGRKIKFE